MRKVSVGDHKKCIELKSGDFRIAVTTEVGPRVIGGFIGKSENLFAVLPREIVPDVGTDWMLYGGHRLWHAPEAAPRTYAPDNEPVRVTELEDGGVEFANAPESLTGIEKAIRILPLGDNRFEVTHVLTNRNVWDVELAPWALSVMAPGGVAIFPQSRLADPCADARRFVVDRTLNLWPYSDYNDPRLSLGREFVCLRQDPKAAGPIKIGMNCPAGWCAYVNQGVAFVKHLAHDADAFYPDNGSNVESYSCASFLEVESLGPLELLAPGEEAVHVEVWEGLAKVGPVNTEAHIKKNLASRL